MIPERFRALVAGGDLDPLTMQLITDGYAVARGAVSPELVRRISASLADRLARTPFC